MVIKRCFNKKYQTYFYLRESKRLGDCGFNDMGWVNDDLNYVYPVSAPYKYPAEWGLVEEIEVSDDK